jgi:ATP-dependent exoDNAse (exonuclease V) beta subunit
MKVCYRTSRQIRSVADRLLPGALRDPDGNEEERSGTISVFDGPLPSIAVLSDAQQEIERAADFLRNAVADGIRTDEIGMFIRSPNEIARARAAAEEAGIGDQVAISVMHLAKGLEFRAVVVMACDQDVLPLESRIAEAADEGELDDIYETERQLLYVACTRARDRLLVAGVAPASEFLKDL